METIKRQSSGPITTAIKAWEDGINICEELSGAFCSYFGDILRFFSIISECRALDRGKKKDIKHVGNRMNSAPTGNLFNVVHWMSLHHQIITIVLLLLEDLLLDALISHFFQLFAGYSRVNGSWMSLLWVLWTFRTIYQTEKSFFTPYFALFPCVTYVINISSSLRLD